MTTAIEYVIWDGCDSFEMCAPDSVREFPSGTISANPVIEITINELPMIEDDERDWSGTTIVSNRIFKFI